jgi:hypothetical protein
MNATKSECRISNKECRMLKIPGHRINLIIRNSLFDIRHSLSAHGNFIIHALPTAKRLAKHVLVFVYALTLLIPLTVHAEIPAIASIQDIRYRSASGSMQVTIGVDRDSTYRSARLSSPDRIYFDISNAKLNNGLNRAIAVTDEILQRIRVAQKSPDIVRVVLDVSSAVDYAVSQLHNPFRIVIELRDGNAKIKLASPPPAGVPAPEAADAKIRAAASQSSEIPRESSTPSMSNGVALPSQPAEAEARTAAPAPVIASPAAEAVTIPPSHPFDDETTQQAAALPAGNDSAAPSPQSYQGKAEGAPGRERALAVNGTFSSGYYNGFTRGGGNDNQSIHFVPAGAQFDIHGYYQTPDLINYWLQPEFNAGPQATDAGFQGGNGIRMHLSALRKQFLPITFRYSHTKLKDVYFGSLSQVSTYTLNNRNNEIGMTAQLQHAGLPSLTLDWGSGSTQSESLIQAIPDYTSHSNHLNVTGSHQEWGWDFRGFAGRQQQTSDLIIPADASSNSSALHQDVVQYQGSARKSFLGDSELFLEGGSQSTASLLLNQPINLTTRNVSASLRMFQKKRWKSSVRAGYTSNIAGLFFNRLVEGLDRNGSIAPDASVLQPLQSTTSYLNLSSLTSVDLPYGLGLYGSMDRTAVVTATDSGLNSKYFTTAGGLTYAHTSRWGSFSGQYGRSFGMGSITGQSGRIEGQNYVVTVQPGKRDGLKFDFSVRGTSQRVHNELPAGEDSLVTEGSVGIPLFGQLRTLLGGGWQQSTFTNAGSNFHTDGYTARLGIEYPRFQLNGSLKSNAGNSLQAYNPLFSELGTGSALLAPLHLIPSDLRELTLALHMNPTRKLELSAAYTRSLQHIEGVVANDFEIMDVYATYRFRKLLFVAGFSGSTQIYTSYLATYPETQRGRFYIRLSRSLKLL